MTRPPASYKRHRFRPEIIALRCLLKKLGAGVEETPQPSPTLDFNTSDPFVRKALLLVQQSLDAPLSVVQIAKHLGITKRRLEQHFESALGNSPQAAFMEMRLSLARDMVENTNKSFAMIAIECGFSDSAHFSRRFRQRFATTPSEFRRSRLEQHEAMPMSEISEIQAVS